MIKLPKISDITLKIEDELDYDFRAEFFNINTIEEFNDYLLTPFNENKKIFYRGESTISTKRTLIPSIYRDRSKILGDELIKIFDCDEILNFYNGFSDYIEVYEKTMGEINTNNLYPFIAFSQHYFGISPFLDFTKSIYVALSFALKNREEYENDILLYTVEIKKEEDYTTDMEVANSWLKNYSVIVLSEANKRSQDAFRLEFDNYKELHNEIRGRNIIDLTSPCARLIDLPTNDLMKFQRGVFLLLDDFTMVKNGYLTKKIRDDFIVKKWRIKKDICPELLKNLNSDYPYYNFSSITDVSSVINKIKNK